MEHAAAEQGYGHMRLPSGAFHDAQFVVPVCPTGMIFVPCRKGISHNPAEYSEPAQLAAGTRVLTQTLSELADADGHGSNCCHGARTTRCRPDVEGSTQTGGKSGTDGPGP